MIQIRNDKKLGLILFLSIFCDVCHSIPSFYRGNSARLEWYFAASSSKKESRIIIYHNSDKYVIDNSDLAGYSINGYPRLSSEQDSKAIYVHLHLKPLNNTSDTQVYGILRIANSGDQMLFILPKTQEKVPGTILKERARK